MSTILWPNGTTEPPAVSSPFGPRNLSNPLASTNHKGVDLVGFEVVHSIADGVVVFVGWHYEIAGWLPVAGYMVWVQSDGFFTRYLHNDADTVRVKTGDQVRAGDPLIDMGWSGLASPWDTHVHVEITPGGWHRGNVGQVDPYAWLLEHVTTNTTTGAGGSAVAPVFESEEDDVKLIRVAPKGRHYAIARGFIKQIIDKESVKAHERLHGVKEVEVDGEGFTIELGIHGISTVNGVPVVNSDGHVLDDRNGQGTYVHGGSWDRGDKAERLAHLAQKIR